MVERLPAAVGDLDADENNEEQNGDEDGDNDREFRAVVNDRHVIIGTCVDVIIINALQTRSHSQSYVE